MRWSFLHDVCWCIFEGEKEEELNLYLGSRGEEGVLNNDENLLYI